MQGFNLFVHRTNIVYVMLLLLAGSSFLLFKKHRQDDTCLKPKSIVAFLNIGQGDAIYIQSSDGSNMLVDTGPKDGGLIDQIQKVTGCPIKRIDKLLLTHPDADHIGEASRLIHKGVVGEVLHNGFLDVDQKDESPTENQLEALPFDRQRIQTGDHFDLGMYTVDILFPDENMYLATSTLSTLDKNKSKKLDDNQFSVVLKITAASSTSFLLTGDAPAKVEEFLVKKFCPVKSFKPGVQRQDCVLNADILKLGHHGSKTSSSALFLQTVSPTEVVVSASKNNTYGHPHKEVMNRIYEQRRKKPLWIRETFREGNIVYTFP